MSRLLWTARLSARRRRVKARPAACAAARLATTLFGANRRQVRVLRASSPRNARALMPSNVCAGTVSPANAACEHLSRKSRLRSSIARRELSDFSQRPSGSTEFANQRALDRVVSVGTCAARVAGATASSHADSCSPLRRRHRARTMNLPSPMLVMRDGIRADTARSGRIIVRLLRHSAPARGPAARMERAAARAKRNRSQIAILVHADPPDVSRLSA